MSGSVIGEGERELQGSLMKTPGLCFSAPAHGLPGWVKEHLCFELWFCFFFFFNSSIVIVNLELVPKRGFQKSLILYSLKLGTQFYVYWGGNGVIQVGSLCLLFGVRQIRIIVNSGDFRVKLTEFEVWPSQFTSIDTVTPPLWGSVFSSVKWVYPIELLLGWNQSVHAKHLEEYSGRGKCYWSLAVMTE